MKKVLVAAAAIAAVSWPVVPSAVAAPPGAVPVQVKYVVGKVAKGSGIALAYSGKVYVPLSAVKQLTGDQVGWDAATSTVTTGAPIPAEALSYLDDLPGQPYYTASQALCWQTGKDGAVAGMGSQPTSYYPNCNVHLPASPTLAGQRFSHEMEFLVSATGAKTVQPSDAVTEKYSLYGRYAHLDATIGLLDNLDPERMVIELLNYGKLLYAKTLSPGSAPGHLSVDVAHVEVLTVMVANVSGAAPNWQRRAQYVPGGALIANPVLIANPDRKGP